MVRSVIYAVLFCATLEVCARAEDWMRWGAPVWGRYSLEHLTVGDSLGYHNRSGARFEKFRINADGFRGGETRREKTPGVIRVGVVGASEAFGLYESPDMELSAQIQRALDRAAPGRFEVINMATIGMTPPRITAFYRLWIAQFSPDVIFFYPTPAQYLASDPPRSEAELARLSTVAREPSEWPLGLRVPDKGWTAVKELLPQWMQASLRRRGIERERAEHASDWVWNAPPPDRLALFGEHIDALVTELQRSGAQVVLATHANRFSETLTPVDQEQLVSWIKWYPRASAYCMLHMDDAANRVVSRVARAHGLPTVDVAAAVGKDPRNFADFVHFSDAGAALAASAAARQIVRRASEPSAECPAP
jgi:hypothetical protein